MYDYDRRQADARPRSYVEAVAQAVKQYGVKLGLRPRVAEARRLAQELDRAVKDSQGINPDDAWAHDSGKAERLWRDLQKAFAYCFGFDPPALGKI
jgi:hypothetical protein